MVVPLLLKVLLSLALGAVIGLEREHSKKQTMIGLRTFSMVSLLGMLLTEMSKGYYLIAGGIGLVGVFALTAFFYYFKATHLKNSLGLTTALVLPLAYVFGAMVGLDLTLEAVTGTIVITYLLIEKGEVHRAVDRISKREIVDGLIFAVIAFVLYPIVPEKPFSFLGQSISLQAFFLTIVLVSAVSFISHMIMKFVHKRAIIYASFLGGLVSSIATITLFAKGKKASVEALRASIASASVSSLLRDAVLLGMLNMALLNRTALLFLVPATAFFLLAKYHSEKAEKERAEFIFGKPLSLLFVLKFSVLLFAVSLAMGAVASTKISYATPILSFFGGAVNSAAVVSGVAVLASQNAISAKEAIISLFLAVSGALFARLMIAFAKLGKKRSNEMKGFAVASALVMIATLIAAVLIY